MAINFPHNPNVNDVHTESSLGKSWKWDGTTWLIYSSSTTGIGFSDLSVITEAPSGGGSLTYASGVFTFKPASGSGGASNFTGLGDTPSSLTAGKWLKVNVGGTALEWTDAPTGNDTNDYLNTASLSGTTLTLTRTGTQSLSNVTVDLSSLNSVPTTITVANESTETVCYPLFTTTATGNLEPKTVTSFKLNSSSGQLEAGSFKKTGGSAAEFLKADGSTDSTTYLSSAPSYALNDLSDVDATTGAANGKIIKYNGTSWEIADDLTGGSLALTDLSNVDATTNLANGKILKYDLGSTSWVVADDNASGGGSSNFTALGDTPSSFTAGKWLKVNAGATALEWTDAPSETDTLQTVTARGATSDQPISVGTTATGAIFSVGDSGTSGDKVIQIKRASTTTDCNIQAVVAGTGAGTLKLNDDGGTVTTGGSLQPSGSIIDKDGQLGNAGQVLSSTGSQLDWIDAPSGGATINNNADNRIITGSATTGELNAESGFQCDGNALSLSDDKAIKFGSNLRMEIYTDGSNNYIKSATDGGGAFPVIFYSGSSESLKIDASGNIVIPGNLTVNGTQTIINSNTLEVGDSTILLNKDVGSGTAPTENAGLQVSRGTSNDVSIRWNETSDKWEYTNDGTNYSDIGSSTTDTNTTYSVSCVDGDNADEEKIRLTAGGSGSGTDDVVLEAGTGLSVARSGDKITFTNTETSSYSLPVASATVRGGVKLGTGLNITGTDVLNVALAIGGLADVTISGSPTSGQVITWSGSAWTNGAAPGVPVGTICMYSGTSAPAGWALCDGGGGRPDLRNKFVVGAGSSYNSGSTGGYTDAIVVDHDHNTSVGNQSANHTHGDGNYNTNATGDHYHQQQGSGSGNTGNQSHNHYHTVSPSRPNTNAAGITTVNTSGGGTHGHAYRESNGHPQSNMSGIQRRGGDSDNATNNTDILSSGGSHNHNVNLTGVTTGGIDQNHSHSMNFNVNTSPPLTQSEHSHNVSGNSGSGGNHSHNVSGNSGSQGSGNAHENKPPYYAITFIIKT